MRLLLPALALALLTTVYALTLASFAWEDLLVGMALAGGLMALYRKQVFPGPPPATGYVLHILRNGPRLLGHVLVDILKGTWQVGSIIIGLRPLSHPGIVKIPMLDIGPAGTAIVSFVVTLSPGSFLIDYDWDERVMLVHYVDISDPDKIRADVARYYRLLDFRRATGPGARSIESGGEGS
jgi:multisubunit Na+/H+ antiporter MnhE subunit